MTLLELLHRQTERFARAGANPWDLAAKTRPSRRRCRRRNPPQLAGWTAVARVLLNLDETITKE